MIAMRPAVAWIGDAIEIIDQTLLPAEERVIALRTVDDVVDAIQRLAVRGAPPLGGAGAAGGARDRRGRCAGRAPDGRRPGRGGADRLGAPDRRQPALGGLAGARVRRL